MMRPRRYVVSGLILFLLAAHGFGLTPFERKYANASAVFLGTVKASGFEGKAEGSPVQKYFAQMKVRRTFKGEIGLGDEVRVLVGGRAMYHDKLYQVADTDLPEGMEAVFYLAYLFPDEREFSGGAGYYLDLVVPVFRDSVYARFAPKASLSIDDFEKLLSELGNRFRPAGILNSSDLVVQARVKQAVASISGGVRVRMELDSVQPLKGNLAAGEVSCSYTDNYRRIHFRNRGRNDVPFYISRDASAQRREEQSNFFLTPGQKVVVCLAREPGGLTVREGHLGIFFIDEQALIRNRYSQTLPKPLKDLLR